jgi:hypothetical protein
LFLPSLKIFNMSQKFHLRFFMILPISSIPAVSRITSCYRVIPSLL